MGAMMETALHTERPRLLPRVDLREEAFRRFEKLIAKACVNREIEVTPDMVEGRRMLSTKSFCTRFRDALRGHMMFAYPSILIPHGYVPYGHVKATETDRGSVWVYNKNPYLVKIAVEVKDGKVGPLVDGPTPQGMMQRIPASNTFVVRAWAEKLYSNSSDKREFIIICESDEDIVQVLKWKTEFFSTVCFTPVDKEEREWEVY